MCFARYIIHVYVCKCVYIYVCNVVSLVALLRHNDLGVTGGPRLYLRAMVEINETKTKTRDGMRCFLSSGRFQYDCIRLYVYSYGTPETMPMTSPANRVATFTIVVKHISSCPRVVSTDSELKKIEKKTSRGIVT